MKRVITICAAACVLAGCRTTEVPVAQVDVGVPGGWSADGVSSAGVSAGWLEQFDDPVLEALVHEAMEGNYDLAAIAARTQAALESSRIARAGLLPQLNGGYDAVRSKRSNAGGIPILLPRSDTHSLALGVNWELDVWGRVRAATDAARADYVAAGVDLEGLRLSLAARVAQGWFDVLEAREQVALAEATQKSFESNAELIEERFNRGLAEALDLRLARANAESAKSALQVRKQQMDTATRVLETLLGRYPAASLEHAQPLPALDTEIPAGIPAEILDRRPDVAASASRLFAADYRVREAKRSLLPAISLTASGGYSSNEAEQFFEAPYEVWTLAGNLTQPIFQGGRLRANVRAREALRQAAWADFQAVVLTAFREVEAALASERFLAVREVALGAAAGESRAAEALAWERYGRGLVEIVTVLETQRRAFDAASQHIAVRNARLRNRVNLHLALGGDFFAPEPQVDGVIGE